MRLCPSIHSPRSINLQRSLQNGRHLLLELYSAGLPQCGQLSLVFTIYNNVAQIRHYPGFVLAWMLLNLAP